MLVEWIQGNLGGKLLVVVAILVIVAIVCMLQKLLTLAIIATVVAFILGIAGGYITQRELYELRDAISLSDTVIGVSAHSRGVGRSDNVDTEWFVG